jgi:hypothetical protein
MARAFATMLEALNSNRVKNPSGAGLAAQFTEPQNFARPSLASRKTLDYKICLASECSSAW